MTRQLPPLRAKIRSLDDDILKLVAERLRVAAAIGQVKAAEGLPIKDFQVERDVQAHAAKRAAELGVYQELATELAGLLIRYAVRTQEKTRQTRQPEAGSRKVLIVGGLGLMGRWLGDFFASSGHAVTLLDIAKNPPPLLPYSYATDFDAVAGAADVIVLSTPIGATAGMIERLTRLKVKALVFDICSLKAPLTAALSGAASTLKITSLHPMFGPDVTTLAGRRIVICRVRGPQDDTAVAEARALFGDTSAALIETTLDEHDRRMALVLGLSHLTNLIFGTALAKSGIDFATLDETASSTFKSQLGVAVPVARENPELYYAIQAENAAMTDVLSLFQATAADYVQAIGSKDMPAFKSLMDAARRYFAGGAAP